MTSQAGIAAEHLIGLMNPLLLPLVVGFMDLMGRRWIMTSGGALKRLRYTS